MKPAVTALLALSFTALAQAQSLPSSGEVIQSISFNGPSGIDASAQVVIGDEVDSSKLYILHGKGSKKTVALINDKLYLPDTQYPEHSESKILSKNAAGSLQINLGNEHLGVGRDIYSTTLTIAYRENAYRLVGFTHRYYDKLGVNAPEHCDYNLITGRGIKNGRRINLSARMPELKILKEEHVSGCKSFK